MGFNLNPQYKQVWELIRMAGGRLESVSRARTLVWAVSQPDVKIGLSSVFSCLSNGIRVHWRG